MRERKEKHADEKMKKGKCRGSLKNFVSAVSINFGAGFSQ